MDKPTPGYVTYEFGAFRLEPRHRVLARADGSRVEIVAKAFDALLYLVERAGTVVARDELMKALWPRTIVEDNSLNKLIAALRRALGADEYIATLPGRGYQFVADVRISEPPAAPTPAAGDLAKESESPARASRQWVVASVLALAFVVGAAWLLKPVDSRVPPASRPGVMRFRIDVPQGQHLYGGNIGFDLEKLVGRQRPSRPSFALSPDGRYLVYAATDGTTPRLYKRRMDEQESTAITGSEGGTQPAFSPDSLTVAFFVGNELKRVPIEGGEVRTIAISGATPSPESTVDWTDNDTVVVTAEGVIYEAPANGGKAVRLTQLDTSVGDYWHRYAQMLPNRRALLLNVINQDAWRAPSRWDIVVQPLDGNPRKVVVEGGSRPVYLASGHIVFARRGQLWAVPFDARRLETTGAEVVVLEDVMHADRALNGLLLSGAAQFSVSRTGTLAYVAGGVYPRPTDSLVWVDKSGAEETLPGLPGDFYLHPRFSGDGTKLVYSAGVMGEFRLWVYDIALAVPQPLTPPTGYLAPVWSPDDKRIAFSDTALAGGLLFTAADGSGSIQRIAGLDGFSAQPSSWSIHDQLAFVGLPLETKNARLGIWTMRMDGTSQRERFGPTDSQTGAPAFSPDGKWIAYTSREANSSEIYVRQFAGAGAGQRISNDGGDSPVWSRDARQLFYVVRAGPDKPLRVMAVDVETEPVFAHHPPRLLFERPYQSCVPVRCFDISPDGKRFVAVRLGPAEPQPVTGINIVVNWSETLAEPAPAH